MKKIFYSIFVLFIFVGCDSQKIDENKDGYVLKYKDFKHYVDYFNSMEDENIKQLISNKDSWEWMKNNIPLFETPQTNFEEIYYYRWWTFRKHIKDTPIGKIITEFLIERSYADQYNMIACAMGHHIMEGRWLHNKSYVDEYILAWFRGNDGLPMKKINSFSNWTPYALLEKYYVDDNQNYIIDLFPDLQLDFQRWEKNRRHSNGLFWQTDVADGMEEQISGGRRVKNARPTINSYMYGNAVALSKIATMVKDYETEQLYLSKSDSIKSLIYNNLWSEDLSFFETLKENGEFANVREAIGFIPWYFNIPESKHSVAWKQLMDEQGFLAPYGQTTAERRHPDFRTHGCCKCEWDGTVWPFASSQSLTALANHLNSVDNHFISNKDYFKHLELYVESQYHRGRPYIGEYLDEVTGYWLKGDEERSRYYNHSTFNDLIITGLVGLRPRGDNTIEVNPLIPANKWDWFCLDNVHYKGNILTIIWDKTGKKYNKGKGFQILVNGKKRAHLSSLGRLVVGDVKVSKQNNVEMKKSIEKSSKYGVLMAQSTIERNPELYRSWGYMQGLLLKSFQQLLINNEDKNIDKYIYDYASDLIDKNGNIQGYVMESFNVDNVNAGNILFDLYKNTKEERFLFALKTLRKQMEWQPRTTEGGFWHKLVYPHQMWLDGAYMVSPFLARYAKEFDEPQLFDEVANQLSLITKNLSDSKTGLLYHGWDESRIMNWSNPETGLSPSFWGRSIGWYVMALVDVIDYMPVNHPRRDELITYLTKTLDAVLKYKDPETGLWYQVIDQVGREGNYLESSASTMFAYALSKGVNIGILPKIYKDEANSAFQSIVDYFIKEDEKGFIHITNGCRVAGLSADRDGSFEYYISEPVQDNDLKSVGPFIMLSIENEILNN